MSSGESSLEAEARKRKERLLSLKRKHELPGSDDSGTISQDAEPLKRPTFRTYLPADDSLKELVQEQPRPPDMEDQIVEQLLATKDVSVVAEVDLTTLQPRKPDWDLKRDVAKKLERLERRTQRAIAELIRERLANNNDELLSAVNSSADAASKAHDSDED